METCMLRADRACSAPSGYRVQSSAPLWGALWPAPGQLQLLVKDRGAAITLAAKSRTAPGAIIEVVHVATGEVVFRKPSAQAGLHADAAA